MMCHTIGRFPIGSIGLGSTSFASRIRVPWPPHRMSTVIRRRLYRLVPAHEVVGFGAKRVRARVAQFLDGTESPRHADASHPVRARGGNVMHAVSDHDRRFAIQVLAAQE